MDTAPTGDAGYIGIAAAPLNLGIYRVCRLSFHVGIEGLTHIAGVGSGRERDSGRLHRFGNTIGVFVRFILAGLTNDQAFVPCVGPESGGTIAGAIVPITNFANLVNLDIAVHSTGLVDCIVAISVRRKVEGSLLVPLEASGERAVQRNRAADRRDGIGNLQGGVARGGDGDRRGAGADQIDRLIQSIAFSDGYNALVTGFPGQAFDVSIFGRDSYRESKLFSDKAVCEGIITQFDALHRNGLHQTEGQPHFRAPPVLHGDDVFLTGFRGELDSIAAVSSNADSTAFNCRDGNIPILIIQLNNVLSCFGGGEAVVNAGFSGNCTRYSGVQLNINGINICHDNRKAGALLMGIRGGDGCLTGADHFKLQGRELGICDFDDVFITALPSNQAVGVIIGGTGDSAPRTLSYIAADRSLLEINTSRICRIRQRDVGGVFPIIA